jgi:hypothetical protein
LHDLECSESIEAVEAVEAVEKADDAENLANLENVKHVHEAGDVQGKEYLNDTSTCKLIFMRLLKI